MTRRFKLLCLVLIAAGLGTLGTSTAQASRGISFSQTRITATGTMTLSGATICNYSWTIDLDRSTLFKSNVSQGSITAGSITGCSGIGSSGTLLTPIALHYSTFAGTLPNITSISLRFPSYGTSLSTLAGPCLWEGALDGIRLGISGGAVTSVDFTGSTAIPKISGRPLCPSTLTMVGWLRVDSTPPRVALV